MKRACRVAAVLVLGAGALVPIGALVSTATPAGAVPNNAAVFSCVHGDTYTPAQMYTVPVGINQLRVTLIGGAGAGDEYDSAHGGQGARVTAVVPVTPGAAVWATVGCAGHARDGGGGFIAGASGGDSTLESDGGAGGGASGISTGPLDTWLAVAGGGGGGGGKSGAANGGHGGDGSQAGEPGGSGGGSGSAGHGRGGIAPELGPGDGSVGGGGGGGGGGGFLSGSGGRGGSCWGCSGGGGGGGSSYAAPGATDVTYAQGAGPRGDGSVVILPVTAQSSSTSVAFCNGGTPESYTVPAGTNRLQIVALGAAGGDELNLHDGHGAGARVDASQTVNGGEQLSLIAGCPGDSKNGGAGYGNGGDGAVNDGQGAGGGGGSAVLMGSTPLVVAGGGGGAGGGGLDFGRGGNGSGPGDPGGKGGGSGAGGGGAGGAASGTGGAGGHGGDYCGTEYDGSGGGGGGGGYHGGNGGGGSRCGGGGGGGGGSSYASVPTAHFASGANTGGSGMIVLVASKATAPGAPTHVSEITDGDGFVTLMFAAPTDDGGDEITSYTITGGPSPVTVATPGWVTITGLTNGRPYTFAVHATNHYGNGPDATVTATPAAVPGAPTNLQALPRDGAVLLAFTSPPTGGAPITYRVDSLTPPFQTFTLADPRPQCEMCATSLLVEGLTNGRPYVFSVRAFNRKGIGPNAVSNVVTPVGPATVPGAPTGVTATAGKGSAVVGFSAPASTGGAAITGYIATCAANSHATISANGTSSPLVVSDLDPGVLYGCTVRAQNGVGLGPVSNTATVTPNDVTAPDPPTGVGATPGNNSAIVTFTPPVDTGGLTIDEYDVTCTGPGQPDATGYGTSSPITLTGFANGILYSCTVVARNNAFNLQSEPSSPATVTPGAGATKPGPVSNVQCMQTGPLQITVTFVAPLDDGGSPILHYVAYNSITEGPTNGHVLSPPFPSPLSIVVTVAGPGSYSYAVVAENVLGFSNSEAPACSGVTIP
jgi:hypothetical protein